jgi:hypothetical protein
MLGTWEQITKTIQIGIIFLVIFIAVPFQGQVQTAWAQEKKANKKTPTPAAVLSAFKKAYPDAVIMSTDKELTGGKTYYEVESVDGSTRRDLLYLPDGTVYEKEGKTCCDLDNPTDYGHARAGGAGSTWFLL